MRHLLSLLSLAWAAQGVPGQSGLHTETTLLSGLHATVLTPFLLQVPFLPHSATFPGHSRADLYHMTNGTMKEFWENELRSRHLFSQECAPISTHRVSLGGLQGG